MSSVNELKDYFERTGKVHLTLTSYLKKLQLLEQEPLSNVYEIGVLLDKIGNISATLSTTDQESRNLSEWLRLRAQNLDIQKVEFTNRFASTLSELLKADNLELRGQYPELKVKYYTIEIDFPRNKAVVWYGPRQESVSTLRVDPNAVYKAIKTIEKNLYERQFDETKFLQEIHEAYANIIRKNQLLEGERVDILAVLKELTFLKQDNRFSTDPKKENLKEYGRAPFSFDLFRLRQRRIGTKTLTLDVATRMNTAAKSGFLWIPNNTDGDGFACAYVAFKENS